ncbi:MAG: M1 family metallopeptidase [Pseudomonadota bacterium]
MALRPLSPSFLRLVFCGAGAFGLTVLLTLSNAAHAQWPVVQSKGQFEDKFRQLEEILPTPNSYRNAGGAPGFAYWQQQADYSIKVSLDETKRRITGSETITYTNNSPDSLPFLWVQLDQNRFRSDSLAERSADFGGIGNRAPATRSATGNSPARISFSALRKYQAEKDNEFGFDITAVTDADGEALANTINGTLMRIDLDAPLRPNQKITFTIDWAFNMVEENAVSARAGYESFDDGNDIFLLAQWYPRMAAYSDYEGWHNKEFMGRGEFTLEFGDFDVEITVPADHIVSASGVLQNPDDVLTQTHKSRLETAKTAERPVFIVTAEEALAAEKSKATDMKTWKYRAENVRDFAWASSRKFIWDAQGYEQGGEVQPFVMAMSFYPKEGEPLWSRYSTQAVIHTMEVYSRMTFDYPYPVSQSVNGPVGGMEYPMITFNGPRTELQDDGERTYSAAEKRFLIGVVIHEVGHNYFPMIVNSDERQWTWMDEGLNTFLQFVSEQEWDPDYRSRRGEPRNMVSYMKSTNQVPIMTNSESILQFGNNAYGKPATALNILRETILGRELFDFAFKTYANRWKFKRPTPSDLFRTLEEASGVDLDWFWHGWFYTTDHVDLSIENVVKMRLDTEDPDIEYKLLEDEELKAPVSLTDQRNLVEKKSGRINDKPWLKDFYDNNSGFLVTNKDRNKYNSFLKGLKDWEKTALERAINEGEHFYVIDFANKGGLVMPLILNITYTDDSTEEYRIPAEIWRRNPHRISKLLIREKEITNIVLDPNLETADVDLNNNYFPRRILPSRIEAYKFDRKPSLPNRDLIQDVKTKLKTDDDKEDDKASDEG